MSSMMTMTMTAAVGMRTEALARARSLVRICSTFSSSSASSSSASSSSVSASASASAGLAAATSSTGGGGGGGAEAAGSRLQTLRSRLEQEDKDLAEFLSTSNGPGDGEDTGAWSQRMNEYAVPAAPLRAKARKPSWLKRPGLPGGERYAEVKQVRRFPSRQKSNSL